jgi:drug/metabolite transporter (DMT)-like permease
MGMLEFSIGITCTLAGSSINAIGLILQKRDVNKSGMNDDTNLSYFLKRPAWVLGILMQTILFAPFFFLGIDLIGLALAQPLATAGLLVFVAGAVLVLKERISKVEWVGFGLLILAVLLVSVAGVTGDVSITTFYQATFITSAIVFIIIIVVLASVGVLLSRKTGNRTVKGYAILMGTSYAGVSIAGQIATIGFTSAFQPGTEALGWLLIVVGLASVVIGTIAGIFTSQRAFQKSKAIQIIPISQAINNILPIVAGVYLFGQFIAQAFIFILAVIMLLIAVTMLSRFQQ